MRPRAPARTRASRRRTKRGRVGDLARDRRDEGDRARDGRRRARRRSAARQHRGSLEGNLEVRRRGGVDPLPGRERRLRGRDRGRHRRHQDAGRRHAEGARPGRQGLHLRRGHRRRRRGDGEHDHAHRPRGRRSSSAATGSSTRRTRRRSAASWTARSTSSRASSTLPALPQGKVFQRITLAHGPTIDLDNTQVGSSEPALARQARHVHVHGRRGDRQQRRQRRPDDRPDRKQRRRRVNRRQGDPLSRRERLERDQDRQGGLHPERERRLADRDGRRRPAVDAAAALPRPADQHRLSGDPGSRRQGVHDRPHQRGRQDALLHRDERPYAVGDADDIRHMLCPSSGAPSVPRSG